MLIEFKSRATVPLLMYEEHTKPICDLLEKNVNRGVITHQEMPNAIALLEKEIAASRLHSSGDEAQNNVTGGDSEALDDEATQQVDFASRAYPFLEMLRLAERNKQPIFWGV